MIKKYLNKIFIATILAFGSFAYYKYNSMQNTIKEQKIQINNLNQEIMVQKNKKDIEYFKEAIGAKKKKLLKELKNEKKQTFDDDATTIYF